MVQIVRAEQLSEQIFLMDVKAPRIAENCLPGQFIIAIIDKYGERIPLTICDYDREQGLITIVFQVVGASTLRMSQLKAGDCFSDFVGPLGNPSEFTELSDEELKNTRFLFIAGGVGTAPVYPQVKYLASKGVKADVIIGARTKDLIILEDQMKEVAGNVYVTTDDGSYCHKGTVTTVFEELMAEGKQYDVCVAIGPLVMMKFCCLSTAKYNLKTIVSLNPIMIDGTGMCGGCRVSVDGKTRFACVEGPEFDGHQVDWDEAMKRQQIFKKEETEAMQKCQNRGKEGHVCHCNSEGGAN